MLIVRSNLVQQKLKSNYFLVLVRSNESKRQLIDNVANCVLLKRYFFLRKKSLQTQNNRKIVAQLNRFTVRVLQKINSAMSKHGDCLLKTYISNRQN